MSNENSTVGRGDSEIVRPAFDSDWQAFAFLVFLVFTLALPALIGASGAISRPDSYDIMPENQGAFSFVKSEIFDRDEPIDLLFVGSSITFGGIDAPQIERELSRALKRPARVRTFGHYFNSLDIGYTQIRDLLKEKKVRMIVLSVPRMPFTEGPSAIAYRFVRYGEDREILEKLPLKSHLALYACGILRAPRDVLTLIRPNLQKSPSPYEKNLGADKADLGAGRDPGKFVRFTPPAPVIEAENMIYSPETAAEFYFAGDRLTNHQSVYLERIVEMLNRENIPFAMINIPQYAERRSERVVELRDWSKTFKTEIPLVGVAPAKLFAGLSEEETARLFYDDAHFNTNGSEFYTKTVLPAILEIYEKNAAKNY